MAMDEEKSELEDGLGDEDDEDTQEGKFLTFRLGDEDYGLEIRYVLEIIGVQEVTDVPDMPDYVKGVINLRGQVIPIMDVRMRFRMPARDYDDRTCIVVIHHGELAVGLVVDTVKEVIDIPEGDISPPPRSGQGRSTQFMSGMGKVEDGVKILLDVNKLLYDEGLPHLREHLAV